MTLVGNAGISSSPLRKQVRFNDTHDDDPFRSYELPNSALNISSSVRSSLSTELLPASSFFDELYGRAVNRRLAAYSFSFFCLFMTIYYILQCFAYSDYNFLRVLFGLCFFFKRLIVSLSLLIPFFIFKKLAFPTSSTIQPPSAWQFFSHFFLWVTLASTIFTFCLIPYLNHAFRVMNIGISSLSFSVFSIVSFYPKREKPHDFMSWDALKNLLRMSAIEAGYLSAFSSSTLHVTYWILSWFLNVPSISTTGDYAFLQLGLPVKVFLINFIAFLCWVMSMTLVSYCMNLNLGVTAGMFGESLVAISGLRSSNRVVRRAALLELSETLDNADHRSSVYRDLGEQASWRVLVETFVTETNGFIRNLRNTSVVMKACLFYLEGNSANPIERLIKEYVPQSMQPSTETSMKPSSSTKVESGLFVNKEVSKWRKIAIAIADKVGLWLLGDKPGQSTCCASNSSPADPRQAPPAGLSMLVNKATPSVKSKELFSLPILTNPERSFRDILQEDRYLKFMYLLATTLSGTIFQPLMTAIVTIYRGYLFDDCIEMYVRLSMLLSKMVLASIDEDPYGSVQQTMPNILRQYANLFDAVEEYLEIPQFSVYCYNPIRRKLLITVERDIRSSLKDIFEKFQENQDLIFKEFSLQERQSVLAIMAD